MTGLASFLRLIFIVLLYIFFIHSSADGHCGYFHILTRVNNTAMNIYTTLPWLGGSIEASSIHQKVARLIQSGPYPGCGFDSRLGHIQEVTDFFLTYFYFIFIIFFKKNFKKYLY